MGASPGGGASLTRLALVSSAAVGFGLTDGVFFTFILEVLRVAGASKLLAFLAIASGSGLSILTAPLAGVLSTTINRRTKISFFLLFIAALSCVGLAIVLGHTPLNFGSNQKAAWRVGVGIVLSGIYRASVQSSPIVPTVIDAAKVRGNDEGFPQRRDIGLSFFYLATRVGVITTATVISFLPVRMLEDIFPILLGASILSIFLCAISFKAMPREEEILEKDVEMNAGEGAASKAPSLRSRVNEHLRAALIRAPRKLKACYIEIVAYGIAFGMLAAVMASFFNAVIFKTGPGDGNGMKWAAFSALLARGIGFLIDGLTPIVVFSDVAKRFGMTVAWSGGAFLGSGLFIALYFTKNKFAALALFGGLAITSSTHGLFSLLAAGALVEPKYRATSFGVRSACEQFGILLGSIGGCFIAQQENGFKYVMLLSAGASFVAGLAAAFAGSVEKPKYAGVAVNANPLISYFVKKE